MSAHRPDPRFVVLVPVKPPAVGKSRLLGLDAAVRRSLAEAFAQDTVSACLAAGSVARVLAVTDDARFSSMLAAIGAESIPDGVTDDLNGALRLAAAEAHRRWPELTPVALCADLPCLRADDLDAALALFVPSQPAFVPDAAGTGTTLYVADGDQFDPRFGPGSRDAHVDSGADELADVPASVRRDVDDLDDLRAAVTLGIGPRTAAVVPPEND